MAYLNRLDMPESERLETALAVLRDAAAVPGEAQLPEQAAMSELFRRLGVPPSRNGLVPAPPIKRTPMAPESKGKWGRSRWAWTRSGRAGQTAPKSARKSGPTVWERTAGRRRRLLLLLIAAPAAMAAARMAGVLPHKGSTGLEIILLVVFAILFAWISVGFWTAMAGFAVLLRRHDRFLITGEHLADSPVRQGVRTAVVFPVYGEDMARVTAGIEAVHRSMDRAGGTADFDFYILSDTRDPEAWAEEEAAWADLKARLAGNSRIFYRRRRMNIKKKSGNIADFCRRYGALYTYMLVMDADSIMSAETVSRMVSVMERNRHVGILQTVPGNVGRQTLLARAQQFCSRLYGPMFAAGFHFWLLGDSQFWGHNALIRLKPFMRHCALPRLSGRPPLGGEILSHDFVESAMMRRAGWEVWLAYDLPGSYEQPPPNLLAELARDRRWCMGNLQHLRLVFTGRFIPIHKVLFLNGVMAYGSALLWFIFLGFSTAEAIIESLTPPTYFTPARSLFPAWPVWEPWWALSLLLTTGVLLFLPKIFSILLVLLKGRARAFGGLPRLAASVMLEVVLSSMLAPIRMLFHSKFVFATLAGRVTGWGSQQREDKPVSWAEAARFHLGGTLLAALWAGGLYLLNIRFFWWVSPIFLPLVLSIPISVATSLPGLGRMLKHMGLLLIPEEVAPPREIAETVLILREHQAAARPFRIPRDNGVALTVVDPAACGRRLSLARCSPRRGMDEGARRELVDKASRLGLAALTREEKSRLLEDPAALVELHRAVWLLPEEDLRSAWSADIR